MFILCHKCHRILTRSPDAPREAITLLGGCGCISGWVRDSQSLTTLRQTIVERIKADTSSIAFLEYRKASGDARKAIAMQERLAALEAYLATLPE